MEKEYYNDRCPPWKSNLSLKIIAHKPNQYGQCQEIILTLGGEEFKLDGLQASKISNLLRQACQENMGFYCDGNVSVVNKIG